MLRLRLKELRETKHISQAQLAKAVGVGQSTVGMWESGKSVPEYKTLLKLADYFQITVDYLTGKESVANSTEDSVVRIPVLGSVPAGIPIEAIEDVIDWEELPASMCSGNKEYFALEVKGDSMWPDYLPGDVVIVLRTPVCDSGDDCIVYVNGYDATLKQVMFNDDGSLTLYPRNQNYAPRTFTREETENMPISIAGVVVELRRKVKKGKGAL